MPTIAARRSIAPASPATRCRPTKATAPGRRLHGIFGRRIATLPGYNFSEPLKQIDIVWTPETVAKLFEVGPMAYTPGTKMPEQIIGSAEDRKALVDFLAKATERGARSLKRAASRSRPRHRDASAGET